MKYILFCAAICATCFIANAQVGINTTTPRGALEISSANAGVLIPTFSLTSLSVAAPVTNPQTGAIPVSTLVFHDGSNAITEGFYYWNGSLWVRLVTGTVASNDWETTGNTGTAPATNFIGTTDAVDFVMRTANTERARIDAAGNLGVGIVVPAGKAHVNQTAGADGIIVSHTGTTGNALQLESSTATNPSSTLYIPNSSSGASINAQTLNATSTASTIVSDNSGLGTGVTVVQSNTGASGQGIFVDQDGTGAFSRGIELALDAANVSQGLVLFHAGTGNGLYSDITSTTSTSVGNVFFHRGLGAGTFTGLTNAANASIASTVSHAGVGRGAEIALTNVANAELGLGIFQAGTGSGAYIGVTNAANTASGQSIFYQGAGTASVVGFDNTAADQSSMGLLVNYNGSATGGTTTGGGNAAEFQHSCTNGNAVEIFVGDPAIAPGPANTTNEYAGLSVNHMGTGTSPTVGASKAAITATNNSADPTAIFNNTGPSDGGVVEAYTQPATAAGALTTGIYSRSDNTVSIGRGVAIWGDGGNYGVVGGTSASGASSNFGVLSLTNSGAFGVKSFYVDHPTEPATKTLRHYSIESNEVLNIYRGVVTLNNKGRAVVTLPVYFKDANKDPSYQLTPIGSPVTPFVAEEIVGNTFVVAGAANTKVSWAVHAQRNDPTYQYFDKMYEYDKNVRVKNTQEYGKYLVPKAHGKSSSNGVFYDEEREKRIKNIEKNSSVQAMKTELKIEQPSKREEDTVRPSTPVEVKSSSDKGDTERKSEKK